VNGLDWKLREGYVRDLYPLTFPSALGLELAGVVTEAGAGVTRHEARAARPTHLHDPRVGVARDAQQHVGVIGQERPGPRRRPVVVTRGSRAVAFQPAAVALTVSTVAVAAGALLLTVKPYGAAAICVASA